MVKQLEPWRDRSSRQFLPIERMLRDFDQFLSPGFLQWPQSAMRQETGLICDVREDDKGYQFCFEMPGVDKSNIDIDVAAGVLSVRGERHATTEEKGPGGRTHVSERRFGTFERSFSLPQDADEKHIEASFENGVLYVNVPKEINLKRQRVEIKEGKGILDKIFPKQESRSSETN